MLERSIAYVFPPDPEATTDEEAELLNLFRSVPDRWPQGILEEARKEQRLYERVGIPERFFEHLLRDEERRMELEEEIASLRRRGGSRGRETRPREMRARGPVSLSNPTVSTDFCCSNMPDNEAQT